MSRKAELEAVIKYYKNLVDVWNEELNEADKEELAKAERELKGYEDKARPTG